MTLSSAFGAAARCDLLTTQNKVTACEVGDLSGLNFSPNDKCTNPNEHADGGWVRERGEPALEDGSDSFHHCCSVDPRFADAASRESHAAFLDAEISAWTRERDAYEVVAALQAVGVAAGVVLDPLARPEQLLVG